METCTSVTIRLAVNNGKPIKTGYQSRQLSWSWIDHRATIRRLVWKQAEGYACSHPQAEGVFLPLSVQPGASELWSLQQHFRGEWGPIDEESARIVDRILRRNGHNYLKVNRARLAESCEAWIHVLIDEPGVSSIASGVIVGFGKCEGILTWPNSD